MTRSTTGATLPPVLLRLLDGERLREKASTTILLATTDEDDWPNLAMLSPGEVLAGNPHTVGLAVHATSRTCRALSENGRGLLSIVADGAAYRIRVRTRHVSQPLIPGTDELFTASVEQVTEDRVDYAQVTHGIRYALKDIDTTLGSWQAKLNRLRQLF